MLAVELPAVDEEVVVAVTVVYKPGDASIQEQALETRDAGY